MKRFSLSRRERPLLAGKQIVNNYSPKWRKKKVADYKKKKSLMKKKKELQIKNEVADKKRSL